jgi:hypothetical protein
MPDPHEPILVADAACEVLSSCGTRFLAGGFGDPQWKVDVYTDMAVIIPQLNSVRDSLVRRQETALAFYEQGIERTVFFSPATQHDIVNLKCVSYGHWVPPEPLETAKADALLSMLCTFQHDIASEVQRFWPELASFQPFAGWL